MPNISLIPPWIVRPSNGPAQEDDERKRGGFSHLKLDLHSHTHTHTHIAIIHITAHIEGYVL